MITFFIYGILNLPTIRTIINTINPDLHEAPYLKHASRSDEALPRGAIVFVHGLAGKQDDAWASKNSKRQWTELMGEDALLKHYDILYYLYTCDRFRSRTEVEDVVGTLRRHIDGDLFPYHHLVIVAHSLGRLVAHCALQRSKHSGHSGQVVTLVTCGSPFEGSDWADVLKRLTKQSSQYIDILSTTFHTAGYTACRLVPPAEGVRRSALPLRRLRDQAARGRPRGFQRIGHSRHR
jgi:hypothetical protein